MNFLKGISFYFFIRNTFCIISKGMPKKQRTITKKKGRQYRMQSINTDGIHALLKKNCM